MYMYFFFCLDTKEKDTKKKKSRLHFLATPLRNFRGQKELATLKQLFVLVRKSLRFALRCKNEVGFHADSRFLYGRKWLEDMIISDNN